jgi:peptidoglycan/xylan/chitin deacetylase (PgdA/CDA1 family)
VRASGPAATRQVGLTVASEDPVVLADTARLLSRHGARATFFAPSAILEGVPDLREILSAAGEVGNGGTGRSVARLAGVRHLEQEIAAGRAQTQRASGHTPAFYLPVDATLTPAAYLAASRQHQLAVVGSRRLRTAGDLRRPLRRGDVAVADLRGDTPGQARDLMLMLLRQTAGDDLQVVDLSEARGPEWRSGRSVR